jgi:hypothetical protein
MSGLASGSFPLIRRIDEICGSPPTGVVPWKGDLVRNCLKRARRYAPDQAAFYLEFLESAQELVPDEEDEENEILKRFGLQSLLAEARVQADDRKVRDHLMHVTQVFLAGWIILNGCRMFRWLGDDWRPYGWALTREKRFKRLNSCWLYAGLLHDCGYSVQYARKSAEDEIFVSDLFGEMYLPSNPGDVEWKKLYKASEDGRASFQPSGGPGDAGIRLVVLGPGARGKSTLLQQLALSLKEQRHGAEVVYIEQMPNRPIDLEQELERLHRKEQVREIFLLVDHLDRLVEEPTGEYWLDQLAQLPRWGWLNVVLASRTDEFDRYLRGPLHKAFREAKLDPASLHSLFGGETDSKGRVRPATILKQIQATPDQLSRATRLALAFGHSRSRSASGTEGVSIDGVSFRGSPLFHLDDRGRGRFVHDAVQDALSAAGLVMQLAERSGGDQTAIELCRTLRDLPRDVPRMLFDLVSARKTRHLSSGVLRAASEGLVHGMLRERSTQQWLADTGRQDQAFDSLKAFDEARGDEGEARLVAKIYLGYALYMRSRIQDFMEGPKVSMEEVASHAEPAIRNMAEGACVAEQLIASTELGPEGDHSRQWYMTRLLFLVDQIFVMLERLFYTPHLTESSVRLARDLMGLFRQIKTHEPLQEGWVRGLLDEFCTARKEDDADQVHIRIYSDAKKVAAQKQMKGFLDLRLCFVATHVGTRMLEHVFSRAPKPPDRGKLAEARRWYYIALARWEQVLRRMTDEGSEQHVEIQASEAQVLSYIGVIWRGICESYLFEVPCGPVSRKLVNRILVAHRHHEDAWQRVDRSRTTAERLPINYRTALAALVSGRFVQQVVFEGLEPDAAEDALKKLAKEAIDTFLMEAEIHLSPQKTKTKEKTTKKNAGHQGITIGHNNYFAIEATCKEDAIAEFEKNGAKTIYYISVPIEVTVHPSKLKRHLHLSAPDSPDVVDEIRSKLGKGYKFLLFSKCKSKQNNEIITEKAMVGKWLVKVKSNKPMP